MKLTFDYYHNLEKVELRLCNPDERELFSLPGRNRNLTLRFNDLSELTFEVDSKITLSDGRAVNLEAYEYIQTKRLVFATNIGWFQISKVEEHDNGVVKYKMVTAESYQAVFKNKGFSSEDRVYCFYNLDDTHDDYYDSTDEEAMPSVLGQWSKQLGIKQELSQGISEPIVPYDDWTVTYINKRLIYTGTDGICRTFKKNTTFGYDWMVNDVEKAFDVVILFDFMYKTIHVMTPSEVAQKVNVIYTFDNFMKSVDISEESDNIVTVLNCNGNNCDITAVNPTGTNYICDFSYYMDKVNNRWMSPELIEKLERWKSDISADKEDYASKYKELRALYQTRTELTTDLQEMSLALQDLKNFQNKRNVLGSGEPGAKCGTAIVESVNTRRDITDGVVTVVGGKSIAKYSKYHSFDFTGNETITAYSAPPEYVKESGQWVWGDDVESKTGTADEIVEYNVFNYEDKSYWYFRDSEYESDYCKLCSASTVDQENGISEYYCGGFDRYIAIAYPYIDENGLMTYLDALQYWINLREEYVNSLNVELYGYNHETETPTPVSIYGQIKSYSEYLDDVSSRLNILSYFADTPLLLRELNSYWIEGDYTNEHIAVLEKTTPSEEMDLSNELMEYGYIELSKVCQPRLSFSLESIDITKQYEFRNQMRLLELGKIITIEKEEGLWYYPALLEISMNLDNSEEFTMTFANAMRLDDWGYTYADLIADASSTSRKVNASWQDILAYSKDREQISSIIRNPLDATLRASFANMANQEFSIDKNGILGRKKLSETSEDFENEQVRLVNNLLIFTDDNWQTARTALGKISYENDNGQMITSYGLVAETIIGSLVMGEKLKIKNPNSTVAIDANGITIKQKNDDEEQIVFQAKSDGTLLVRNYASQSAVDDLTARVEENESQLSMTHESIEAKVQKVGWNEEQSFMWSLTESGFTLYSNGEIVMSVVPTGLRVTGKITATSGYIGELDIINSGLIALNSSKQTLWYLNQSGLFIPSTEAKIRVGNLEISNYESGGSLNTYMKTFGDLTLAADAGASISFSSDASIVGRTGTITLHGASTPILEGKKQAGTWLKITTNVAPFYDCTVNVYVQEYGEDGDGNKYSTYFNVSTALTIPAGETESEPVCIRGTATRYVRAKFENGPWSAIGSLLDESKYEYGNWYALSSDGQYTQRQPATKLIVKGHIVPDGEPSSYNLGTSTQPWNTVYTQDGTVSKSDINAKNTIQPLNKQHEILFDSLLPVSFKYNNGSSDRKHFGFIAQNVKGAILQSGLTTQDFAGYCEWMNDDGSAGCGLRYHEFIALNTYEIQKLKSRIQELEDAIGSLMNK